MANWYQLTPTQIACMTSLTRSGVRNLTNRKPYRTKEQKAEARKRAYKHKGAWRSPAAVSYHPEHRG